MSITPDENNGLTYEELARIVMRNKEERRLLTNRIGMLEGEKAALMAIVQELQTDLAGARHYIETLEPIPG